MLHKSRTWCLHSVTDAEDLARKLTESTWTLCTAFGLADYVFANDSTSPDGAQEFAVLRSRDARGDYQQVETITFSWCTEEQAFTLILSVLAHQFDEQDLGSVSLWQLQHPHDHMVCQHCA